MRDQAKDKLLAEWFWTDRWSGSMGQSLPIGPRGLYREMLTQAWRKGASLPNDHGIIMRLCAVTPDEWAACWPSVASFWRVEGDRLVNETQVEVYAKAVETYERNSRRTSAATAARLEKQRNEERDVRRNVERDVAVRVQGRDTDDPSSLVTTNVTSDVTTHVTSDFQGSGNVTSNVTSHPPSPSPSPSPSQSPSLETSSMAATPFVGATIGADVAQDVVVVNDPFAEQPGDRERAIAELGALCQEVALREGKETREVLIENSRTARGNVITNPASASLDWICQTIANLKARGKPPGNGRVSAADRTRANLAAIDELIERAKEREQEAARS